MPLNEPIHVGDLVRASSFGRVYEGEALNEIYYGGSAILSLKPKAGDTIFETINVNFWDVEVVRRADRV